MSSALQDPQAVRESQEFPEVSDDSYVTRRDQLGLKATKKTEGKGQGKGKSNGQGCGEGENEKKPATAAKSKVRKAQPANEDNTAKDEPSTAHEELTWKRLRRAQPLSENDLEDTKYYLGEDQNGDNGEPAAAAPPNRRKRKAHKKNAGDKASHSKPKLKAKKVRKENKNSKASKASKGRKAHKGSKASKANSCAEADVVDEHDITPAPARKRRSKKSKAEATVDPADTADAPAAEAEPSQEAEPTSKRPPRAKAAPKRAPRAKAAPERAPKDKPAPKAKAKSQAKKPRGRPRKQQVEDEGVEEVDADTPNEASNAASNTGGRQVAIPEHPQHHEFVQKILECLHVCEEHGSCGHSGKHTHPVPQLDPDSKENFQFSVYWTRNAVGVKTKVNGTFSQQVVYFAKNTPCCATNILLAQLWVSPLERDAT